MTTIVDEQLEWLESNGYIQDFLNNFYKYSPNLRDPEDCQDSILDTFPWILDRHSNHSWSDIEDNLLSNCRSLGHFAVADVKPFIDFYCSLHYPELLL